MKRYLPDVSPLFKADRITNSEVLEASLRWRETSSSLKQEEKRSRRSTLIIVAAQLALTATLATTSQPLYIWLILFLVATTTITAHILERRSKKKKLIEELKQDTKLLYASYLSMFKSVKTKGNSTVTPEECANLMTTASTYKTSLLGKVWSEKPPIPMSREETAVRRIVTLSPEELTDLIHRILTAIIKENILPHLPSKTVNLIVDVENVPVTGKKLIRRALDYVVRTHKANHTLPYLRISILPEGFTSPALPIYITIPRREESPAKHILRVAESLRELGLSVGEAYLDSNLASTSLFLALKEAGITLIARWTKNEPIKKRLTPHLKLEKLKTLINQFSDTLERRIREVEDPRIHLQAKQHILRGNLAVLGKALAHLATIDPAFTEIKEDFKKWMESLPPAFFWTHTQRSKKDRGTEAECGLCHQFHLPIHTQSPKQS
jgi:hypothetical protein